MLPRLFLEALSSNALAYGVMTVSFSGPTGVSVLFIASGDDSAPVAFVGTSKPPEAFCAITLPFKPVAKTNC